MRAHALQEQRTAQLPECTDVGRVRFKCADACNLPRDLAPVDAILAANLLCRLPDPVAFLDRLPALLRPGGVVVLTTPWSWLEAWTKRPRWLGGCAPVLESECLAQCPVRMCRTRSLVPATNLA